MPQEKSPVYPIRKEHEVLVLDRTTVNEKWQWPSFQRVPVATAKVKALAKTISETKVIPGELTVGKIAGSDLIYKVDCGHRLLAFDISTAEEAYADVTVETFNNMKEMARAYRERNTDLRRMRPDDILKSIAEENPVIQNFVRRCPFVGFDGIRRSPQGPLVSLAVVLRCWQCAKPEVPTANASATDFGEQLRDQEAEELIDFLQAAHLAWGRDKAVWPLWSGLNLTLCMWLWRRVVLHRPPSQQVTRLEPKIMQKCFESLARHKDYSEWILGKKVTSDDCRRPGYRRMVELFTLALRAEAIVARFPQPAWAAE